MKIEKIKHCILTHRYKTENKPQIIEAKILFDADKLDSLGAIAIMRAGMWMGRHKCRIISNEPLAKYAKRNLIGGKLGGRIKNPSLHNIFYEFEIKNKKIPASVHTKTGKKIAGDRLKYMEKFMDRLKKEIAGEI